MTVATNPRSSWDCIIIGAGPAGCTAAYFLARAGARVLVLERGPYPGSKTMCGLSIYTQMLEPVFPGLTEEAPLEGPIVRQEYWLMTDEGVVNLGLRNMALGRPPYNRFAAFGTRFVGWLAGKAASAGAVIALNHKVDRLIVEGGAVRGAIVSYPMSMEFKAPVVIVAEGAAALVSTRSGLIRKPQPSDVSLYVKETMALPANVIRDRFGLPPGTCSVIGLFGASTGYVPGTSSLYTYRDHISLNVGATIKNLKTNGLNPLNLIARLKNHPFIKPLINGARTVEFGAHLIPDGGFKAMPEITHPGALIVGDAAGLVNGVQGFNLALYSGKFAAQAALEAHHRGDFSKKGLRVYQELLDSSFVIKDLKKNARVPGFYERHPDVMSTYPKVINEVAYQVGMVYPIPKRAKRAAIAREIAGFQPIWKTVFDIIDTMGVII